MMSKFKLVTAVNTNMVEERRGDFKATLPAHLAWVTEAETTGGILGPRGPVRFTCMYGRVQETDTLLVRTGVHTERVSFPSHGRVSSLIK